MNTASAYRCVSLDIVWLHIGQGIDTVEVRSSSLLVPTIFSPVFTRGRPKPPKGEAKGKIVPIRFTKAEAERLAEAAKRTSQTLSE
jgi:hypothetical protein